MSQKFGIEMSNKLCSGVQIVALFIQNRLPKGFLHLQAVVDRLALL